MRRIPVRILALLTLLMVAIAGCGGASQGLQPTAPAQTPAQPAPAEPGTPQDGGHLKIALAKDLVTLDPTFAMDNYSQHVIDQIYDTLVTYGPDGSLRARLATDWQANSETEWEFALRQGVKFHNGREMTADDVVWTVNRMLDPDTKVPRQHLFMVEKVEKTGDYAVTFTLNQAYAPFLSVLANRALSIIPREAVEEHGEDFARNPVGTGPFKFVSWNPGEGVILERNADYFFARPHLDRVTFQPITETAVAQQQLETGDVDVIQSALPDDIERLKDAGLIQLVPGLSYYYALFNLHPDNAPIKATLGKNPFLDKRVREAITLAFPVGDAIRAVYPSLSDEIRAYGPVPNANWAFNPSIANLYPEPNLELARELLRDAGYPGGFKTEILAMSDAARRAIAQILQNSLSQIGIEATITSPEFGVLLERANNQTFDIGVFGWGGSPDPHDFLFPLLHTDRRGSGGNNAYFSNADVDRLIDQAATTTDQAVRARNYAQIQEIFVQEYVHLPLFYNPSVLGIAPRVQDLKVDPLAFFRLVTEDVNVWIKQ